VGLRQRGEGADRGDAGVEIGQRDGPEFGDGVEVRPRHALVGVVAAQAVEDEVVQFGTYVIRVRHIEGITTWANLHALRLRLRLSYLPLLGYGKGKSPHDHILRRVLQKLDQIQLYAALNQRPRQAQRVAAQGERVLVAGRLQARGETAGQG